ncbi:MAG: branched-chain amino acid ABC transporter permease [Nitrospirota bacterium]
MKTILIAALWFGFIAIPFMGLKGLYLALAILIGWMLWMPIRRISESGIFNLSHRIQVIGGFLESKDRRVYITVMAVLLIAFPLVANNYWLDIVTLAGIYVILAIGLNVVVGLAGLLNLGFVAFYAVGAYTYAILSTYLNIPFWSALPAGMAISAISGVLLGFPALRLRGDYLAIVTLGFGEIVHLILNNWDSVTGGPNGIPNIAPPVIGSLRFDQPVHLYYLMLFFVMFTVVAVYRINNSRIGRAWVSIREDEIAAECMGINTFRMKLLAFAFGALWAGLAGVFFASKMRFVSPESFTFFESIIILCMVILGGLGSIPGSIAGAIILVLLPEVFRGIESYRMLAVGAVLILFMVFRPQGLFGGKGHPKKSSLDFLGTPLRR